MELALALGMTLTDMLERMPSGELALWRAKWRSSPWGDRREDERHAMRLQAFVGAKSKKGSTFSRADFYPFKRHDEADKVAIVNELSKAGNIVVKGSAG